MDVVRDITDLEREVWTVHVSENASWGPDGTVKVLVTHWRRETRASKRHKTWTATERWGSAERGAPGKRLPEPPVLPEWVKGAVLSRVTFEVRP